MIMSKRNRPQSLPGSTQRISTGWGKVYVTVNRDEDGEPFEIFVATGQSGGFVNSWCEAIGKTLSNALRSGLDAEELARDLIGIRSPKSDTDNGDWIHSIPDAVGVALLREVEGKQGESIKEDDESDPTPP